MKRKGMQFEYTATFNPQSNGKSERLNQTLKDAARTMLMPLSSNSGYWTLWAEAVQSANYVRSRLYTTANSHQVTPFESAYSRPPKSSLICFFGCASYVHIHPHNRKGKFSSRAKKGILEGYDSGNAYMFYMPDEQKMFISRDVTFDENDMEWDTLQSSPESHKILTLDHIFETLSSDQETPSENKSGGENHTTQNNNPSPYMADASSDDQNSITTKDFTYYPPDKRTSVRTR